MRRKYNLTVIGDYKTEVESVQLGNAYIADMDKCPRGQMLW